MVRSCDVACGALLLVSACSLDDEPSFSAPPEPKAAPAPKAAEPKAPVASEETSPWQDVTLRDTLPFCVLEDMEKAFDVEFLKDAKQQTLRAGSKPAIGVYAHWCVSEKCDDVPSLECKVEREGEKLIVHSRYWGKRTKEAACEPGECRPVFAHCEMPELPRGKYTLHYGEQTYPLRVPSKLKSPCFGADRPEVQAPPQVSSQPAPQTGVTTDAPAK